MNKKQKALKRQYLLDQQRALVSEEIFCLEAGVACKHLEEKDHDGVCTEFWCSHPGAITLRGVVLYRSFGGESLDAISAPKECMLRKPCSHRGCQNHVTLPCEQCNRQWGGGRNG